MRAPSVLDSKDMLRQRFGRTFPSLCGHVAASFVAFLQGYRHLLI
jgi:hypothetical protein